MLSSVSSSTTSASIAPSRTCARGSATDAIERALWSSIKRRFTELIDALPDLEFDKTFFNSVTRRTFGTIGVDAAVEFVALDLDPMGSITTAIETTVYGNRGSLELLFEEVLADFRFRTPYLDFDRSVRIITNEVRAQCEEDSDASRPPLQVEQVELVRTPFFQMTRAYLVGRISGKGWMLPFVLALKNTESGVLIDAIMMDESSVSILFSFTRSYFHVDLPHVGQAVVFLKTILPRKPVSELYTVLGRAKQGKTERYRELFRHLQQSTDRVRARAGRSRHGDDLLHAALVRRGVQDHPRPVRISEEHPARGSAAEVRAGVQARPRRPAGRCAGVQAAAVPDCALLRRADRRAEERGGRHRALRGRRAGDRPRVHRAAHDAAESLHPQRLDARTPSAPCSTMGSASATWR